MLKYQTFSVGAQARAILTFYVDYPSPALFRIFSVEVVTGLAPTIYAISLTLITIIRIALDRFGLIEMRYKAKPSTNVN